MTDAPEKIWVWLSEDDFGYGGWSLTDDLEAASKTEYTRTDISQARIAHALSMVANGDDDILKLDAELQTSQTRVASLEAALKTAREDALREAASICAGAGAFADEMEEPILDLIGNESKP
jgi:predicted transcriptional regulator